MVTEATEQLSEVVGAIKTRPVAVQPVLVVAETGTVLIVGLVVSVTETTCVAVALFPEPSVTVQVTVVFPKG